VGVVPYGEDLEQVATVAGAQAEDADRSRCGRVEPLGDPLLDDP
jgi:hypothetical protein